MPVYTYQCEECGVRFDARQHFNDDPITVCPECNGPTHKVIGPVGVVFKGKGFYVTDSRSSNRANLTAPTRSKDSNDSSSDSTSKTPAENKNTGTDSKPSGSSDD